MKKLQFTKMAGAGNDFIVIENSKGLNVKKLAVKACDRSDGLGADGILFLDKSKKADYRMRIINADGSEAEMCGNGARCMASYIVKYKKPKKKVFTMDTPAGIIAGQAKGELAEVELSDPQGFKDNIALTINKQKIHVSYIDTGVPHTIVYVDDLSIIDVNKIGNTIRHHKAFKPRGTNVNFVEQINSSLVDCRTYERGVEAETRACGTGSVAAAIVTYCKLHPNVKNKTQARMRVKTKSSEILNVTFDIVEGKLTNVRLKGSAKFIAKGEYYV